MNTHALDLAEELETMFMETPPECEEAAAELRRLYMLNQDLLNALKIAEQFMIIANDWNVHEAEINREMRSTYHWIEIIEAAINKC